MNRALRRNERKNEKGLIRVRLTAISGSNFSRLCLWFGWERDGRNNEERIKLSVSAHEVGFYFTKLLQ